MPSIYIAVQCGPDYDVSMTAHATREQAQTEVCAWLDDYGPDYADEIAAGKRAIMADETAYMSGGEHWFEARSIYLDSRPINGAVGSALIAAIEGAGFNVSGPTDSRAAEDGEPAWVCNARAALAELNAPA